MINVKEMKVSMVVVGGLLKGILKMATWKRLVNSDLNNLQKHLTQI